MGFVHRQIPPELISESLDFDNRRLYYYFSKKATTRVGLVSRPRNTYSVAGLNARQDLPFTSTRLMRAPSG